MGCLADEVFFAALYLTSVITGSGMFCVSHDNGDSGRHAIYFTKGFCSTEAEEF